MSASLTQAHPEDLSADQLRAQIRTRLVATSEVASADLTPQCEGTITPRGRWCSGRLPQFGGAVREARTQTGLTHRELADRANVSRPWLGNTPVSLSMPLVQTEQGPCRRAVPRRAASRPRPRARRNRFSGPARQRAASRCAQLSTHNSTRAPNQILTRDFVGGRHWDRTSDLFRVREARYRCASRPGCFEVETGFEPVYTDLQSVASPLGHSTGESRPRLRCLRPSPSGRRDSNPRPSPWQGDALPTEPRPHAPGPFPAQVRVQP